MPGGDEFPPPGLGAWRSLAVTSTADFLTVSVQAWTEETGPEQSAPAVTQAGGQDLCGHQQPPEHALPESPYLARPSPREMPALSRPHSAEEMLQPLPESKNALMTQKRSAEEPELPASAQGQVPWAAMQTASTADPLLPANDSGRAQLSTETPGGTSAHAAAAAGVLQQLIQPESPKQDVLIQPMPERGHNEVRSLWQETASHTQGSQ